MSGDRRLEADGRHRVFEQHAIFGLSDRSHLRANQAHPVLRKYASIVQFERKVERGLTTEGRQERVGALALDDGRYRLHGERLDVGAAGPARGSVMMVAGFEFTSTTS